MPHVLVIAGPNGAGKTTTAPILLDENLAIKHFVNADAIALGLSAFAPEKAAIPAGKAMLKRIDSLSLEKENFAFETTLASRTFAPRIIRLKEEGYQFHLTFLMLDTPELAISRVKERVRLGGHHVPEEVIRRRFEAGLSNFFNLYEPIADSWQIYDNSVIGHPTPIASKESNHLKIWDAEKWEMLKETYA